MKTCSTCVHRHETGWCSCEKLVENAWGTPNKEGPDAIDMLIYDYWEGGEFWVGPNFGCVHHSERLDALNGNGG